MEDIYPQLLSGIAVAIVSFGFGYFLFRSQTNEQIRLEVYRRRLNAYEKIFTFLEDVDELANAPADVINSKKWEEECKEYRVKAHVLYSELALYLPSKLIYLLIPFADLISELPRTLADIELQSEIVRNYIEKDVGERLVNWRTDKNRDIL